MVTPVRASTLVADVEQPSVAPENQGSYPAEITSEQFTWLQERAAAHRRRWAEHAASLACNQKS
jgi:hypothetical protein